MKKIFLLLATFGLLAAEQGVRKIPARATRAFPPPVTYLQYDSHAYFDVGVLETAMSKPDGTNEGYLMVILTNSLGMHKLYFNTAVSGPTTNKLAFLETTGADGQSRTTYTNFFIHIVGYGTNDTIYSLAADLEGVKIRVNSNHP